MTETDLKECPFCGGTTLDLGSWSGESGEFDAIECRDCLGAAPASVWNARADDRNCDFLSQALNEGDGIYRP